MKSSYKKKTKNEKEREKPEKETVRINFRMKKSKVKDGKEKSVKLRNEKEDDNELDENSDSTSTTSERNTHQDLLNPLPSVIPQVLRVPDKKILPGATTRLVEQPYWYTTKIVEEERPDLAGKEGKLSLDKEEVELLDKYIREKSELFIGDLIITDDNMDEDDRRYSRYEVQLKYNEGRYSAVYIIARQTCAKNVFKEDGTLFAMKTGLRRNSATIVLRMKRELRTMQELNKGKCPYVPMVLDHGKVCDMPFIVMTLLDMNLEKLREELGGKFKLATVFYVANETLSAIWDLHIRGYVHRDIKPTNFCLGVGTMATKVFLIDFGETVKKGKKIKYSTPDAYSLPYWSIESHKRGPAKERADIESWFYMILDMFQPSILSWRCELSEQEVERAKTKFWSDYQRQMLSCPSQLVAIANLIASSGAKMDYGRLRKLIREGLDASTKSRSSFVPEWVKVVSRIETGTKTERFRSNRK